MKLNIATLTAFFLLFCLHLHGQDNAGITLQIISAPDGAPVANATVEVRGGNTKFQTDENGFVRISPSAAGKELRISHVAFIQKVVHWSMLTDGQTIALDHAQVMLDEVELSTGYQMIGQRQATGSFAFADSNILSLRVGPTIMGRLDGLVSGVAFDTRLSGMEGVAVRGPSTIDSDKTPLVVLDNFPFEGNINGINPNDIESVTILKDAAAASIWGARAANGVIVITTKKGRYSTPFTINATANYTLAPVPEIKFGSRMLPSADFVEMEKYLYGKGYYQSIETNPGFTVVSPVVETLISRAKGNISDEEAQRALERLKQQDVTKDFRRHFYRNGHNKQYALSFSGGSPTIAYNVSGGYDGNRRFIARADNERITFNSNATFRPYRGIEINSNLGYSNERNKTNGTDFSNVTTGGGRGLYPYAKLVGENGEPLAIPRDYSLSFAQEQLDLGWGDWFYRPLDELRLADRTGYVDDLRIGIGASVQLLGPIKLDANYQYQRYASTYRNLQPEDSYAVRDMINRYADRNSPSVYPIPRGGVLDRDHSEVTARSGRAQLNYNEGWGGRKHVVNAIAGIEVRQRDLEGQSNRLYGYDDANLTFQPVDYINSYLTFPTGARLRVPQHSSLSSMTDRFFSYYLNAAYVFDDKVSLSASARKDASNLFGVDANQKGVPLWSVGGAWTVSNMGFYSPTSAIPYLKVRATFGYGGNVNKTLTRYSTAMYITDYNTGLPYALILTPPNPSLRWEKTGTFNLGVDFETAGKLFYGTVDVFRKSSVDLIGQAPLDPTTGFFVANRYSFIGNNSSLLTNGMDIQLSANPKMGGVDWTSTLLLNYQRNRVVDYKFESPISYLFTTFSTPVEGKPLFPVYSYPWAGLNPETGAPRFNVNGEISEDYTAVRSDMELDSLIYHGSTTPNYTGGWLNTFRWRKLTVSLNIGYVFGGYMRMPSINYTSLFNNWIGHQDFVNRWQQPGDEAHTSVPSLPEPGGTPNRDYLYTYSDVLVARSDYIHLRDLTVSYAFAGKSKGWGVDNLEIYFYMNNLGHIWVANKQRLNPRTIESLYGPQRNFALGFRIKI